LRFFSRPFFVRRSVFSYFPPISSPDTSPWPYLPLSSLLGLSYRFPSPGFICISRPIGFSSSPCCDSTLYVCLSLSHAPHEHFLTLTSAPLLIPSLTYPTEQASAWPLSPSCVGENPFDSFCFQLPFSRRQLVIRFFFALFTGWMQVSSLSP